MSEGRSDADFVALDIDKLIIDDPDTRSSYVSHADSKSLPTGLTKKLSDFARMTILIVQIGDEATKDPNSNFKYLDIVKSCNSVILTSQIVHAPVSVSSTGTTISGMGIHYENET
jgi:hypothetical protein